MLLSGVFLLTLAASQPNVDVLQKVAVSNDTWRAIEYYEYSQERDKLLYLYSAILYTKLKKEEWKGIEEFASEHPSCDMFCVIGMVKREMEKR